MKGFTHIPTTDVMRENLLNNGWGFLITPGCTSSLKLIPEDTEVFLDNGAWMAHKQGKTLNEDKFIRCLYQHHERVSWYVLPDIVEGGLRSLSLSFHWLEELRWAQAEPALAVQDGIQPEHLDNLPVNIFIGGSTRYKERSMKMWADYAHKHGKFCHVGRVNTRRRMRICMRAYVDSFDGSGAAQSKKQNERSIRHLNEVIADGERLRSFVWWG